MSEPTRDTTLIARALDSSQFDENSDVLIGRRSVWPLICSTQGRSLGISAESSSRAARNTWPNPPWPSIFPMR